MSNSGGRIMYEQAYAQGKMLDSSGWQGVLARGITPSDFDWFVESSGRYLVAEFTRGSPDIDGLSRGQAMAMRRFANRPTGDAVVVCRHSVPSTRAIDTKCDVEECTVYFAMGSKSVLMCNEQWQELVIRWASNPADAARWLDSLHNASVVAAEEIAF